VTFLLEHAFETPRYLIDPDIVQRIEASGAADRILSAQRGLLGSLMSENRLKRMSEHAARVEDEDEPYRPINLMRELSDGIFDELEDREPSIDLYRRNLQRAYADMLIDRLENGGADSDTPALARGELKRLADKLERFTVMESSEDPKSLYHLQDLHDRIAEALEAEETRE